MEGVRVSGRGYLVAVLEEEALLWVHHGRLVRVSARVRVRVRVGVRLALTLVTAASNPNPNPNHGRLRRADVEEPSVKAVGVL